MWKFSFYRIVSLQIKKYKQCNKNLNIMKMYKKFIIITLNLKASIDTSFKKALLVFLFAFYFYEFVIFREKNVKLLFCWAQI